MYLVMCIIHTFFLMKIKFSYLNMQKKKIVLKTRLYYFIYIINLLTRFDGVYIFCFNFYLTFRYTMHYRLFVCLLHFRGKTLNEPFLPYGYCLYMAPQILQFFYSLFYIAQ